MTDKFKTIFVGYDIREIDAYNVLLPKYFI